MEAAREGFQVSLLERLYNKVPENKRIILTEQYRMNKYINQFPSEFFYHSSLQPTEQIAERTLKKYVKDSANKAFDHSLVFYKTDEYKQAEEMEIYSYTNKVEAALILSKIEELLRDTQVKASDIGVITGYTGQVKLISKLLSLRNITGVAWMGSKGERRR